MLALTDMVHLLADEFSSLRGWRFSLPGVPARAFESLFFRHE